MYEDKFILRVDFSDGTSVHYVLDVKYLTSTLCAKTTDYSFLNNYPDIILSEELVSKVVKLTSFSIGNGVEY